MPDKHVCPSHPLSRIADQVGDVFILAGGVSFGSSLLFLVLALVYPEAVVLFGVLAGGGVLSSSFGFFLSYIGCTWMRPRVGAATSPPT